MEYKEFKEKILAPSCFPSGQWCNLYIYFDCCGIEKYIPKIYSYLKSKNMKEFTYIDCGAYATVFKVNKNTIVRIDVDSHSDHKQIKLPKSKYVNHPLENPIHFGSITVGLYPLLIPIISNSEKENYRWDYLHQRYIPKLGSIKSKLHKKHESEINKLISYIKKNWPYSNDLTLYNLGYDKKRGLIKVLDPGCFRVN